MLLQTLRSNLSPAPASLSFLISIFDLKWNEEPNQQMADYRLRKGEQFEYGTKHPWLGYLVICSILEDKTQTIPS